jgi:transposase
MKAASLFAKILVITIKTKQKGRRPWMVSIQIFQTAIIYFARPDLSLQDIANESIITKQAAFKRVKAAREYFQDYAQKSLSGPPDPKLAELEAENARLNGLVEHLRRQLIVHATMLALLSWFQQMVARFFPKMKLSRFEAWQNKYLLDMCEKFQRAGGTVKELCQAIGKSHDTISRWRKAYEKYGMAGLTDKTSRPHHFSRKIPRWLKNELLILFLRHPRWTPYQYYKYIRDNPAINYSLSLSTITKLKDVHQQQTEQEKARMKKRWAFTPNYSVWAVDYTTLLKTDRYRLQLLTVSDQRSRFLFETALFLETSTETLTCHLEELFCKYGKPSIIKADNGPEMRMDLRENLEQLCVHLLNSPTYYPQFCGAHERLHRELKTYIDEFNGHRDLMRLIRG